MIGMIRPNANECLIILDCKLKYLRIMGGRGAQHRAMLHLKRPDGVQVPDRGAGMRSNIVALSDGVWSG